MSIKIHILSSSKEIKPFAMELRSVTKSVVVLIKKLVPLKDIDVVFYYHPEGTIKEIGIGGYTPIANTVFISLDPKHPKFKENFKVEIIYTLIHEINHAIRFRTFPGKSLLDAMISEGLADHFAMEVTKRKRPQPWSTSLTAKQKKEFLKKVFKEWNKSAYDHNAWFYGSVTKKIPRWTAYTLGYDLVATYLQKHPNIPVSKLISAKASVFI